MKIGAGAFIAGFETYEACHPDDDKCKKILEEIYTLMKEVESRLVDIYVDKLNLKVVAPDKPSPSLPKGTGHWNGHIQQITEKQGLLKDAIQRALSAKCNVPPFAWKLAYAAPPPKIIR